MILYHLTQNSLSVVSLILACTNTSLEMYTWSHAQVLAVVQDLVKVQSKVVKQKPHKRKTTAIPFIQEHKASLPDYDRTKEVSQHLGLHRSDQRVN